MLQLQKRLEVEGAGAQLLRHALDTVTKRVGAGEGTRLDGNRALVEAERAAAQQSQTAYELTQARAALAIALQLAVTALPEVIGSLAPLERSYSLDDLLLSAGRHPRLQVAAARVRAAIGRVDLERGARYPDVTVGLSTCRSQLDPRMGAGVVAAGCG